MNLKTTLVTLVSLGWIASAEAATPAAAKAFGTAIADVVEQVMPSVVVVRTETTRDRLVADWFFDRIYRIPERLAGQGSGVIITKDGYVLTNRHVVDGAQDIEVVFNDETFLPAILVGEDPHTDLAVLKIQVEKGRAFAAQEPGDSDKLRVGEFVLAIGSPFSLGSSVTLGIVSQKGLAIGALPYEDFIQTDAAVNRGNSGGPLVDLDGRLVGLNTMIQTAGSEGNIGISFAIPINLAMNVAQSIIRDGSWRRPWIGIMMDEAGQGVLVARVVPGSPAAKAGLKAGDVLTLVGDRPVRTPRDVQRFILSGATGSEVALVLLRGGKEMTLTLRTEPMPIAAPPMR